MNKVKVRLNQEEIDKLVYVLNKTKTEGYDELTQEGVDELVNVLLETKTMNYISSMLLDSREVYDYFALKLSKERKIG